MASFKRFLTESETDVSIPMTVKRGRITDIDYRQTRQNVRKVPSTIAIDVDGIPSLYVTLDEFNRIRARNHLGGMGWEKLKGRPIEILLLRRPDDQSETLSQVQDVRIY